MSKRIELDYEEYLELKNTIKKKDEYIQDCVIDKKIDVRKIYVPCTFAGHSYKFERIDKLTFRDSHEVQEIIKQYGDDFFEKIDKKIEYNKMQIDREIKFEAKKMSQQFVEENVNLKNEIKNLEKENKSLEKENKSLEHFKNSDLSKALVEARKWLKIAVPLTALVTALPFVVYIYSIAG